MLQRAQAGEETTPRIPAVLPDPMLLSRARRIVSAAARVFGVNQHDITGSPRFREAVLARRAIAAILVTRMGWSHARVGRFINRDHTSILHALRRYRELDDMDFLWRVAEVVRLSQADKVMPIVQLAPPPQSTPPSPSTSEEPAPPEKQLEKVDPPKVDNLAWLGPIYVEARIPHEWNEAFLAALRREHGQPPSTDIETDDPVNGGHSAFECSSDEGAGDEQAHAA